MREHFFGTMSDWRPRRGDRNDSDPEYEQDQWRKGWGRYKANKQKLERDKTNFPGMSWHDWKSRAERQRYRASREEPREAKDKASRPKQGRVPMTDSEED